MPCNDKEWKPKLYLKSATMTNFHYFSISGPTCPFNPDGVFGAQGNEIQCFRHLAKLPHHLQWLSLAKVRPNAITSLTLTSAKAKLPIICRIRNCLAGKAKHLLNYRENPAGQESKALVANRPAFPVPPQPQVPVPQSSALPKIPVSAETSQSSPL